MDKTKTRQRGYSLAIAVLATIAVILYVTDVYLSRLVGAELSHGILLLVGLFIIHGVFEHVPDLYIRWESRRYCEKHGHLLESNVARDGREFVHCNRCGAVLINERVSKNAPYPAAQPDAPCGAPASSTLYPMNPHKALNIVLGFLVILGMFAGNWIGTLKAKNVFELMNDLLNSERNIETVQNLKALSGLRDKEIETTILFMEARVKSALENEDIKPNTIT